MIKLGMKNQTYYDTNEQSIKEKGFGFISCMTFNKHSNAIAYMFGSSLSHLLVLFLVLKKFTIQNVSVI